jgi:hypothetical protein
MCGAICFYPFFTSQKILWYFIRKAYWAIVYFGQIFENYRSSPIFWAAFYHNKRYVPFLAQNVLGYIMGDFL